MESKRLVSLFDVLGPIMIGPSSSHTAGVLRIGRMARSFLGGDPEKVELRFYGNALARTYKGHLSDSAIVAGLLGFAENSTEVPNALKEAASRGISVGYKMDYGSEKNPNTVDMRLEKGAQTLSVTGITVGGGEILMTGINDFPIMLRGSEEGVMLTADTSFDPVRISSLLGETPTEIRTAEKDGHFLYLCILEHTLSSPCIEILQATPGVKEVFPIRAVLDYKLRDSTPLFSSIEEMLRYADEKGCSLAEAAVDYECRRSGLTETEVRLRISRIWKTMAESVEHGLRGENDMVAGLVPGNGAAMMFKAVEEGRTAGGPILGKAVARAIAAMETNACARCVVAAPTAGSCGVVPGALLTLAEEHHSTDDQTADALLISAVLGTLIAMRASLSGSIGGCQAEIGVASAMAAGGLVHLSKGTSRQIVHGMALALKNILGLICDPVAGPVEIPCIKRNGIGVANAFAAADMALSGLESAIPPDEIIGALVNTQELLPSELRGTMKGGLGSTPTAIRMKKEWDEKIASLCASHDDKI
ncbi:L-serine ammonia-lyase, iron-sulfur-dependent, subunit alpha [Aminivibrio sp.]